MGKALIIAEKPSVANDIAKALGGFTKQQDYFESERHVLSWALGHLLELHEPLDIEVKHGKWTFAHLPVIPDHFELRPIEKSEARLKLLVKLIERNDVASLINACDAGREGELIFRHLVEHAQTDKVVQRLWLQSMTPEAVRNGFNALRSDAQMRPLANAARCRSEADWLVGINGTRAMTAFNSKSGGFQLTTVGRVQTPTLAIVIEREERVRKFVPRDYWEVHGTFGAQAGEYAGRWFDEKFARDKNGDAELRAERVWELGRAEALRAKCLGKPGVVSQESKPATQLAPLLYDLTSLQREANGRFGFSAHSTLQLAQALYERHKALTYPRTDSRALPEDYLETVKTTLAALAGTPYGPFAGQILQAGWVRPNKRVFNNAKISDHFAIIPTAIPPKHLNEAEAKLYDLVTKRFLAVFYPAAEFLVTTRITRVEGEPFKSEGKVMVQAGWLAVYGREAQAEDTPTLTPVQPNEIVRTTDVKVVASQTKPPPRFTDATLLTAMEGAGKLIEDEELRAAMSAKGLGTPATRAAIIEGLIGEQYLLRHGKELAPTAKAFSLLTLLKGLSIPELCSPELTGDWEFKLKQMEQGRLSRPEFMRQIQEMTRQIVAKAKGHESDTVPGEFAVLRAPCPKCGGELRENYRKYQCQQCDFALWKIVAGRQLEPGEVEQLVTKRVVGPLQGFRSKQGRPFSASIRLTAELKPGFDFDQTSAPGQGPLPAKVDFAAQQPLGKCPACGAPVFEDQTNYLCAKAAGLKRTCQFRCGKVILQQPLVPEQFQKLLTQGKTDLLDKFVSKRGYLFAAYLVLKEGAKVGFEFEPRPGKQKAPQPKAGQPAAQAAPVAPVAPIDFGQLQPVGKCPKCGARVFETEPAYLCERSQDKAKPCEFRSGRVILKRLIERDQMAKLLSAGRTDLLDQFISKRGRPFSAYLVLAEEGRVNFAFPSAAATSGSA
jgi:DNA topoisomerase-3